MKSLHTLIHSLNKHEQKVTRTALTCFSGKKDLNTKSLKLFDYLIKNKNYVPTNSEGAAYIYNDPKDERFRMLKYRFRQKLLDSIVLDLNLSRKGMPLEVDQENIKVRKKISQLFYLYYIKGIVLDSLLTEIIDVSKKYEFYFSLIEALRFKKTSKGFLQGESNFNKINKEIAFYDYCNHALYKANDYYYLLIMRVNFHARTDKAKMNEYLKESIDDLKKDYKYTRSSLVGYYLKLLEMTYYENLENYQSAKKSCTELLIIVTNNISVYRKSRLCTVYMNLCQYNIFLGNYKKSIDDAKKAQNLVPPLSAHYLVSKEWEFNALFYENRIDEAEALIISLISKAAEIPDDDFRIARYRFYLATILFKKGNYRQAFRELNEHLEISKDKEGWGTAIRLLTIMSLIEMARLDEVTSRLDTLRKHIERNVKKTNIREREKIILKVLQVVETSGFSVNIEDNKKITSYLKLLNSDDKVYKWLPLSSEVIPFHKWFVEKYGR